MKWLVLVMMVFCVYGGYAQALPARYLYNDNSNNIDSRLLPDSLAKALTKYSKTEKEKVSAIFRWITDNIAYGVSNHTLLNAASSKKYKIETDIDSIINLKPLNEQVAYSVLQKRMAVCNGYTKLFKTLCDYAGIRSEIIIGFARGDAGNNNAKFRSNHTWNAVMIDSAWHLLDVTWASGYILYGSNEFVRQYDDFYFLTPPRLFLQNHFPEDPKWTLLDKPFALKEFNRSPFRSSAFLKYKITSFTPSTGLIEASVGDTLTIELNSSDLEKDNKIAPDRDYDSLFVTGFSNHIFLHPTDIKGNKEVYSYVVPQEAAEWLNIVYNNDLILRYNLKVKKEKLQ